MAEQGAINLVSKHEVLYRRIPKTCYISNEVLITAFLPTEADHDGISLAREIVGPAGAAATGRMDREFYVAEISLSDLPDGLSIVPDSNDHAVIPQMTHAARNADKAAKDQITKWAELLRLRCKNITGPYPGQAPIPPKK